MVRTAHFPPVGFSTEPSVRAWAAACRSCGSGAVPLLIARSAAMDGPGWQACMAAAHSHITKHRDGGRI